MKGALKLTLKSALAILLVWVLFSRVDWQEGFRLLGQMKGWPLVGAFLLFPLGIWLSTLKWMLLLRAQGLHFTVKELVRCYWIGFFANNFLPSSIGGDLSRVGLLRTSGHLAQVAASIVVERLTGVVLLLLWAAGVLLMGPGERLVGQSLRTPLVLCLLLGVLVLSGIFFSGGAVAGRLAAWGEGRGRLRSLLAKVAGLAAAVAFFRGQKMVLLGAFVLSVPFYLTPWLLQWLLFKALSLPVALGDVFLATPLINLVGLVPATPNALGLTEGAYVVFYGRLGVGPEEALAVALVARMLGLLASLFGGLLWLLRRREADGR